MRPIRGLPMVQNWDCRGCGDCCRIYSVRVSPEEKQRILDQDWSDVPELAGVERVVWEKKFNDFRLNHDENDVCIFLDANNRCRIHAKFGAAAKPMACRLYPYMFAPAGDHWRVGLRFACPAVLDNAGRPVRDQEAEVQELANLFEANHPRAGQSPTLATGQTVPWPDLQRIANRIAKLLGDEARPIETKLREALALSAVCRKSRFDSVTGDRLDDFLDVLTAAMIDEVPADPHRVPAPGWTGRMIFRQVAAMYSRKDQGEHRGVLNKRSALGRLAAGFQFALGTGHVPRIHGAIGPVKFTDADRPIKMPLESELLLARYYRIKVESLSFFGSCNFGLTFWDGFDTLALTFPALMWLARLIHASGTPFNDAITLSLRTIDDNFGHNPQLVTSKQVWALKMLAARGDLPKLIAWYGREH